MAQKTFNNVQLATHWNKVANAKGTRRDVVLGIMGELGIEDNANEYRKVYNNVTQRVKQLTEKNVVFQPLSEGKKGARQSGAELSKLQTILDTPAPSPEEADEAAHFAG